MSAVAYVISYRTLPSIERAARRTMSDHLDREQGAWKPFLDMLASEHGEMQIPARQQAITGRQLATAFDMLRAKLDDPDGFGRLTADSFRRTTVAPPPSGSTEGQLVLGLHAAGRASDAAAAYAGFVVLELSAGHQVHRPAEDFAAFLKLGGTLLAAGHVAAALPASKLASSGIGSAKAKAEDLLASLDGQVAEVSAINADHAAGLSRMRDLMAAGAVRLRRTLLRAERERDRRQRAWRADIEAEVEKRFREAEARLQALDLTGFIPPVAVQPGDRRRQQRLLEPIIATRQRRRPGCGKHRVAQPQRIRTARYQPDTRRRRPDVARHPQHPQKLRPPRLGPSVVAQRPHLDAPVPAPGDQRPSRLVRRYTGAGAGAGARARARARAGARPNRLTHPSKAHLPRPRFLMNRPARTQGGRQRPGLPPQPSRPSAPSARPSSPTRNSSSFLLCTKRA
ncbi:hypothetical protein [Sphingomonas sp. HMP9]|uniref:hypothetical protein n=1 Tax=Sphingomonas sp. HMP9 TaxID=1517554 RepID=UPI0015965CBB|nr:hypothetical protein [Sphingomonas sp. HMP9]